MKKLDRKTCSGISPIAGAKKQTSQRTVINIIIAYSENIASYFYLRRGEHQIMKIGARIRQIRQHQHMPSLAWGRTTHMGTLQNRRWKLCNGMKLPCTEPISRAKLPCIPTDSNAGSAQSRAKTGVLETKAFPKNPSQQLCRRLHSMC